MLSSHLLLEEPIRKASILEPSKPNFFPAMTKMVGTLGQNLGPLKLFQDAERSVESTNANESILKVASYPGKAYGVIKPLDRVAVYRKVGNASVVKIIEL